MLHSLIAVAVLLGSGVLWLAGLQLFLRSRLSRARKISWGVFLLFMGSGIGFLLPMDEIWSRFLVLMLGLPILAVADVWLLRSGRGLAFWIRACGFEVCSVFGIAGGARYLFELAGIAPLVRRGG